MNEFTEPQVHLIRAYDSICMYNELVNDLYRFWYSSASEYPFHQLNWPKGEVLMKKDVDITTDMINDFAKEIAQREKELRESREKSADNWTESLGRDILHNRIDSTLSNAKDNLRAVRDNR